MSTHRFNEAEMYLIHNWPQVCRVEKSMKDIQVIYEDIGDRVLDEVARKNPELSWSYNGLRRYSGLWVGRKNWRRGDHGASIGIANIGLEAFADDISVAAPLIGIWTGKKKDRMTDLQGIKRLLAGAETLLTTDELEQFTWHDPVDYGDESEYPYHYQVWRELPEKRSALRDMLSKKDGQEFVDCLAGHFEAYTRFIPVLDEVFPKPATE